MRNVQISTIILALLAIGCEHASIDDSPEASDTGDTPDTDTDTTGDSTTDTGDGDPLNPWCCWCDAEGETRCVDWQGALACTNFGEQFSVDAQEAQCTGLPVLGTLECVDLVCEAPAVELVLVVDANDLVVGELLTPALGDLANHEDVFAGNPEVVLHLTSDDGFGFLLNWAGPSFIQLAHDDIMHTGLGCEGTPVDWMASMKSDQSGLPAELCNDAGVASVLDKVILHYGQEAISSARLDLNWPGALGWLVTRGDSGRWYRLPMAQEWPGVEHVASQRLIDGTCVDMAVEFDACVVTFEDTAWTPAEWVGPYRIVKSAELP